jgi:hypothetical protein
MVAILAASPAHAEEGSDGARLMLQIAPLVIHYDSNPAHNNFPRLVGLEYESSTHWSAGGALFRNSYKQPSSYWYVGKRWFLNSVNENLFIKLTGGVLTGYDDPYEDKIPMNKDGVALAVIPSVGYQHGRFNAQVIILGGAAIMLSLGYDIKRWD